MYKTLSGSLGSALVNLRDREGEIIDVQRWIWHLTSQGDRTRGPVAFLFLTIPNAAVSLINRGLSERQESCQRPSGQSPNRLRSELPSSPRNCSSIQTRCGGLFCGKHPRSLSRFVLCRTSVSHNSCVRTNASSTSRKYGTHPHHHVASAPAAKSARMVFAPADIGQPRPQVNSGNPAASLHHPRHGPDRQ